MLNEGGGERIYPIRFSDEFVEGLAGIWPQRVLDHVRSLLGLLQAQPELGSPDVRASLARRYGTNLRKLTVSTFVIVYRFSGDVVDVLAIVHGPQIV